MANDPPVTEIVYITLKPGVDLTDVSSDASKIWKDTIKTLEAQDGYKGTCFGRTVEKEELLMMFIDWTSHPAHQKFISSPQYTPFVTNLKQILTNVHFHHFIPTPFPPTLLTSSPMIEFVTFYHIDATFPSGLDGFLDGISGYGKGPNGEGPHGWVKGVCVEEEGLGRYVDLMKGKEEGKKGKSMVLCGGWDSVDAHMRFRDTETFQKYVPLMRGNYGSAEMFHVAFTKA